MTDEHDVKAQKVRDEIWGLPPDMTANVIAAALREAVAWERKRAAGIVRTTPFTLEYKVTDDGVVIEPDQMREQLAAPIEQGDVAASAGGDVEAGR